MKPAAPLIAALLLAAACTPKAEPELDGAPKPAAEATPAPGELAGGPPPGALLPGVINLVPPASMQAIDNCEAVIATDYSNPPKMTCLLFYTEDAMEGHLDAGFTAAMSQAGWAYIRTQGGEHYFERPKPGGDCADVAAVSNVGDRTQALVDHVAPVNGPPMLLPTHHVWQAYAIPASIREACGPDRMKP